MFAEAGDHLCHALKSGGCERSHIVNAIGVGAVVIPIVAAALFLAHRSHH